MAGFDPVEIVVDKNAIRINKFPQGQSGSGPDAPNFGASDIGKSSKSSNRTGSNSTVSSVADDGELNDEDIQHLKDAAQSGDKESADLLKYLGIPLGIAGAVGAGIAGKRLLDARAKARMGSDTLPDGSPKFIGPDDLPPMTPGARYGDRSQLPVVAGEPGPYLQPPPKQVTQEPRLALPAPHLQLPDQTGTRFQQPAPPQQYLLPDLNQRGREVDAAYEQKAAQDAAAAAEAEMRAKLGQSVGMKLRAAAKAVRRF